MKKQLQFLIYGALLMSVIGIDQWSKWWALSLQYEIPINPFLSFDLVFNPGISWGLCNWNSACMPLLLTILIMGVVLLLCYYAWLRYRQGFLIYGELLLIAGAVSNVIDRLTHGAVIDFILVHYGSWNFPLFNVADIAISIGAVLFFWSSYWE